MSSQAAPNKKFTVEAAGARLDHFLAGKYTGLTRSQLHRLIVEGSVRLNGVAVKPSQRVRPGDQVSLAVPPPRRLDLAPQWMPLTLVYQDSEIAVIDKPAGLSVHPGPGHPDRTLVNALLAHLPDIQGVGGEIRPGIVHRLDKDTSGLMVVAKTHQAHLALSDQIKDRKVTKGYLALATGTLAANKGHINAPISRDPRHRKRMAVVLGGRPARTGYRVLETFPDHSLLEVSLETGRTHQIRVHLAHLGHPLLADSVYGRSSTLLDRHFLHANLLEFRHPTTGDPVRFRCDLPPELASVVELLRTGTAGRG